MEGPWGPALETQVLVQRNSTELPEASVPRDGEEPGDGRGCLLAADGGSSTSQPEEAKCASEGISLVA